jgi:hypothetical protein
MGEWRDQMNGSMADQKAELRSLTARRADLNRRLRLAFIEGAEERSRARLGRGLTDEELQRVLRRYPGDAPER